MKRIYISFLIAFLCVAQYAFAQPAKFNYQGVARNATGGPLASQNLGVRISIIDGSPAGTNVYTETHAAVTNAYGLYVLAIGNGTPVSGDINTIDWGNGDKFMKVEIDPAGGTAYADMGTTQLLSVPYATYAKNAGSAKLALPYSDTLTHLSSLLKLENNGDGAAIEGYSNSTTTSVAAVRGVITNTSPGGFSSAVRGINNGTGGLGVGVWGSQDGSGWGVYGTTPNGLGVYGNSSAGGTGVYANSSSGTGLSATSNTGSAATFDLFNNANTSDVVRVSTIGTGKGITVSMPAGSARGIDVAHAGGGVAVYAASTTGVGVQAASTSGVALQATSNTNSAASFTNTNNANSSATARVTSSGTGGGITVQLTNAGNGARGIDVTHAGVGPGVFASTAGNAIWGVTSSISSAGVIGDNTNGEAVVGRSSGGNGVGAVVGRSDGAGYGVRGFNTKAGVGVLGQSGISAGTGVGGRFEQVNAASTNDAVQVDNNGTGHGIYITAKPSAAKASLYAVNTGTGYAGYFSGKVHVNGTLSKSAGTFRIDHPQDPANKYLVHSFVESPDMMNVYNGNAVTNNSGSVTVELPAYFQAENIDFKYQLTVIGQFAQAIVAEEISNNRFMIKTDKPNVKVSWQVTGVRNDQYAQRNRIIPEVEKAPEEKGYYLNPEVYDMPASRGIFTKAADNKQEPGAVTGDADVKLASGSETKK